MTKKRINIDTIESDRYIKESGVQGGKIITEHLAVGCFLMGIPFFIMGLYGLVSMIFDLGFPTDTASVIGVLLVLVIGLLLIISGYTIYKAKQVKH